MKPSSQRRIDNFRLLIARLAEGSMDPHAVTLLLSVSHKAARNYLHELVEAGVARPDTGRPEKTFVRLHAERDVSERFLDELVTSASAERISVRRSAKRHDSHIGSCFVHVLRDDVSFPLTMHRLPVRRDPLVAALFGSAG